MTKAETIIVKHAGMLNAAGKFWNKIKSTPITKTKAGIVAGGMLGAAGGASAGAVSDNGSVLGGALAGAVGGAVAGGLGARFSSKGMKTKEIAAITPAKEVKMLAGPNKVAPTVVKRTESGAIPMGPSSSPIKPKSKATKTFVDAAEVAKGERHQKALDLMKQRKKINVTRDAIKANLKRKGEA